MGALVPFPALLTAGCAFLWLLSLLVDTSSRLRSSLENCSLLIKRLCQHTLQTVKALTNAWRAREESGINHPPCLKGEPNEILFTLQSALGIRLTLDSSWEQTLASFLPLLYPSLPTCWAHALNKTQTQESLFQAYRKLDLKPRYKLHYKLTTISTGSPSSTIGGVAVSRDEYNKIAYWLEITGFPLELNTPRSKA